MYTLRTLHLRIDTIEYVINEQLEKIYGWLRANKLKLNKEKSKFMLLRSVRCEESTECSIRIANERVEQVKEYKYLGVMVDEVLNFEKHMQYVIKKMSAKTQFIRRMGVDLSLYVRSVLYKAIVAPHLGNIVQRYL